MGSPTSAQKNAAKNLGTIADYNAGSTKQQLDRSMATYDVSDKQNKALAGTQYDQNSEKTAGERFAQAKKLQTSAGSVFGAAGNAMQGSARGTLAHMLGTRNDLDTGEALGTLATNQDAVRNALTESINANIIARRDAASDAEKALRDIESDTASQLNNLNPKLFDKPGTGRAKVGSKGYARKNRPDTNTKRNTTPYILPPPTGTMPGPGGPLRRPPIRRVPGPVMPPSSYMPRPRQGGPY